MILPGAPPPLRSLTRAVRFEADACAIRAYLMRHAPPTEQATQALTVNEMIALGNRRWEMLFTEFSPAWTELCLTMPRHPAEAELHLDWTPD